ncbi:hypothetical protein ACFLZC_01400 [Patescibacteria group bacterium]
MTKKIVIVLIFVTVALFVNAQEPTVLTNNTGATQFQQTTGTDQSFGAYADKVLKFSIVFSAILAVIMITVGGFEYIMAGGNMSTTEKAKTRITQAVLGLLLVIASYLILETINPDLINLEIKELKLESQTAVGPPPVTNEIINTPDQQVVDTAVESGAIDDTQLEQLETQAEDCRAKGPGCYYDARIGCRCP